MEKWHAAVARSTFASQNAKKLTVLAHFWKWDVEKWHAAVARSAFATLNVKKLRVLDHFLEVGMWKICTPL